MHSEIGKIIIIVLMLVSAACPADAELKLESVYPTLGEWDIGSAEAVYILRRIAG